MGRRRARVGVLGGTFDHLHAGHRRLLAAAFQAAERVRIGVTTDAYLRSHPKVAGRRVQSYRIRRARLARYLRGHFRSPRWRLVPLEDDIGGALSPDVQLLVASDGTRAGAQRVNTERRRRGLRPVRLRYIPIAVADDLLPLSSTRIRLGIVGADGRHRRPIRIAYPRTIPRAALEQLMQAMADLFPPGARLDWIARTPPTATPGSRAVQARAQAMGIRRGADWAVGIGHPQSTRAGQLTLQVALADATGPVRAGGPSVRLPRSIAGQLRAQLARRRRAWVGRRG